MSTEQIIDFRPTAHKAVDLSVATTVFNRVVSEVEVKLRSTAVIADPVDFVSTNSLYHEINSKGGLDEETSLIDGVLSDTELKGAYHIYTLTYTVSQS